MKYNVQYSRPTDDRIAISDWIETITIQEAESSKEAIQKVNRKLDAAGGTWMILDCWPV
jgi:hypothetical protein